MRKVILMIDISRASGRQFLRGIEQYIHTQEEWEVYLQPPNYVAKGKIDLNKWIKSNKVEGIIVRDSPYLQQILKLDIPKIVFESKREVFPGIATITSDNEGISRMAAEYFIGLGFRNFAYCGFGNLPWSKGRLEAYRKFLKSNKNYRFFKYDCQHGIDDTVEEKKNIYKLLTTIPKPSCVFTCNDERGVYVLEACKIAGIKVPEEIAVLGIDNDELICKLSSPPLSSIKVGFEKAGFEAAEILNQQMKGDKSLNNITVTAKAQYLVKRQSSDVIAINDIYVTQALVFIRKNYKKAIQVSDVVESIGCSRRLLEQRFKSCLQRSINDEINRLRIEQIKLKLINSHAPIYKIAESLPYTDAEHFNRYFRKIALMSPTEYRHRYGKP